MTRHTQHTCTADRRSPRRLRIWSIAFVLASGGFLLRALPDGSQAVPLRPLTTTARRPLESPPATIPIQQVDLGDRVSGTSPLLEGATLAKTPLEAREWKHVSLRMPRADGHFLHIELLRPMSWLHDNNVFAGETTLLDLPEMGACGPAEVLAIANCPPLSTGNGNLVTGLFMQLAEGNILDLHVDGLGSPIGVTDQHLFWSEDRQRFVAAVDLRVRERLRSFDNQTRRIRSIRPRGDQLRVYNLEVQGAHVYQVSETGILVHNISCGLLLNQSRELRELGADRALRRSFFESGPQERHRILSDLGADEAQQAAFFNSVFDEKQLSGFLFRGDDALRAPGDIGLPIGSKADVTDPITHLAGGNGKTSIFSSFSTRRGQGTAKSAGAGKFGGNVFKVSVDDLRDLHVTGAIDVLTPNDVAALLKKQGVKKKVISGAVINMTRNNEVLIIGQIPEGIVKKAK